MIGALQQLAERPIADRERRRTGADGGVRLVCMSSEGAALLRRRLKSQIISDTARRTANSTRRLPW